MARRSVVIVNPILPQSVQEDQVRLNMLTAIARVMADVKRDFQRTVATWEHDVKFTTSKTLTRSRARSEGSYGFTVETDDEIWGWLNEGTDVRKMGLTEDWRSKTTPDSFDSGQGQGSTTHFGIHEGIQARNWTKMAANIYEPLLRQEVAAAMMLGFRNQRLLRGGG